MNYNASENADMTSEEQLMHYNSGKTDNSFPSILVFWL